MSAAFPLDPVALLHKLTTLSGKSQAAAAGPSNGALEDYVSAWFETHGLSAHRLERSFGRSSIVGIGKGTGGGRSLLFNSPLTLAAKDRRCRSASVAATSGDEQAGDGPVNLALWLAAMMVAAECAMAAGVAGDILVACVEDQERGRLVTGEVFRHFTADAAIVTVPAEFDVTTAHGALSPRAVTESIDITDHPSPEPIVAALCEAARRPEKGGPKRPEFTILRQSGLPCVMVAAETGEQRVLSAETTGPAVEALADILTETALRFCR